MPAPIAAPSMMPTPGTTAPTAVPPSAPTAAPCATSPAIALSVPLVAQALSDTDPAIKAAKIIFFISISNLLVQWTLPATIMFVPAMRT